MILKTLLCCALLVPAAESIPDNNAAEGESIVGRTVPNFTLSDYRGKSHSLSDFSAAKIVVIAFLGTECPIVKLYAQRLQELAARHADQGVVVLGVDSNQHDSLAEMEHFARTHQLQFPLLKDPGNRIADLLGASGHPKFSCWTRSGKCAITAASMTSTHMKHSDSRKSTIISRQQSKSSWRIGRSARRKQKSLAVRSDAFLQIPRTMASPIRIRSAEFCNAGVSSATGRGKLRRLRLDSYDEVVGWAGMIEEVVREERMPPWHAAPDHGSFANDRRMSNAEKQLVYKWVADGAPQGDLRSLPPPEHYVSGWQLPQNPDMVVKMRDIPFDIAAAGEINYQYFVVDPGFKEDKWVTAAECVPGNRKVVHHILVFAQPPGSKRDLGRTGRVPGRLRPRSPCQATPERDGQASSRGIQAHFPAALHSYRHGSNPTLVRWGWYLPIATTWNSKSEPPPPSRPGSLSRRAMPTIVWTHNPPPPRLMCNCWP